MVSCAVFGCKSQGRRVKQGKIKLHRFPVANKLLIKQWIHACRRTDKLNMKNARVCSRHFNFTDYTHEYHFKKQLFNKSPQAKRVLKASAVPTLHLPKRQTQSESSKCRKKRCEEKNRRQVVQDLLDRAGCATPYPALPQTCADGDTQPTPLVSPTASNTCSTERQTLSVPPQIRADGDTQPTPLVSPTASNTCSMERETLSVCWSCCACMPTINENTHYLQEKLSEVTKDFAKVTESNRMLEVKLDEICAENSKLSESNKRLAEKLEEVYAENRDLRMNNSDSKQKIEELRSDNYILYNANAEYRNTLSKCELEKSKEGYSNKPFTVFHDQVAGQIKDILSPYFSDTQIAFFLTGVPVRKWSDDDVASALAFRAISPNGYHYLREQMKLPFPSVSTLQRWTKGYRFTPGLLDPVLKLMKRKGETLTHAERACILSFDEMKVTRAWEYRRVDDTILQPHNYVQVAVVRGIKSGWKQVVFYDFDTKMTYNLLTSIITAVEQSGYEVHATVCDMGGSNYSLLNQMRISEDRNFFENPFDSSRNIHVFADVPHLIKLIRNHFIDHGFHSVNDEETIECDSVKELLAVDGGNLKLAPKLTSQLFHVKGLQRQRVKFAVQLLSETVAKALCFLGERGAIKSKGWLTSANFIKLVNDWFDIFNSSMKIDPSGKRSSFQKTESQLTVLSNMITKISSLRVNKKRLPFQKGIVISCRSLISLYDALHVRFGLQYILTRRLNQDVVESFFSVIRQMGRCYDHPTPLSFQHRLKIYIMGKETTIISANANSSDIETTALAQGLQEITVDEPSGNMKSKNTNHENASCLISTMFTSDLSHAQEEEASKEEVVLEVRFPEDDATDHFLGYVVHKFQTKYPELGQVLQTTNDSSSWDAFISKGGLKIMNPEYRSVLLNLEQTFRHYHGEDLKEGKGSIDKILQVANLPPSFPTEVAIFFVRCRIYFRIRQLNLKSKELRLAGFKKMKKTVS